MSQEREQFYMVVVVVSWSGLAVLFSGDQIRGCLLERVSPAGQALGHDELALPERAFGRGGDGRGEVAQDDARGRGNQGHGRKGRRVAGTLVLAQEQPLRVADHAVEIPLALELGGALLRVM